MSTTRRGQHLLGKELGSCILEKLLGYGGSSAVFLAQQHTPQRKVAVKVFLPRSNLDLQMQRSFYTRFLHEAEAASELDHPAILPIYAYGEQDSLPYIVMPYMQGGTLAEYIGKNGPLSVEEAQWYLEQIASALDYAHEHGCVHCDVKPANILLDGEGHAMLSDFGIARVMQLDPANKDALKRNSETLMGTPDYISPEQALGQPLDGRSDVYSLGVTLFYLLTGSPPFKADNSITMALLHVHEPPPSLSTFRDDISPALDRVVGKALAKWPDDRFQTAGEFSSAFARAVSDPESFEEADAADANGKIARGSRSTPRHVPANSASASFVHVRPVQKRTFSLSRTLLMILLVLAVLGSTITAAFIIWLANSNHSNQNPPPTATATKTIKDILADDKDGWLLPGGSSFTKDGQCRIVNDSSSAKDAALALYETSQYSDFRLTVTMSEVHGPFDGTDYYGVIFRSTADESSYYLFEIVAAEGGGQYAFWQYDASVKPSPWTAPGTTPAFGYTPSFSSHPGESNTVTIEAKGTIFTFLINGKQVGSPVIDSSKSALTSGQVGLFVEQQGTEVVFSKMHIEPLK